MLRKKNGVIKKFELISDYLRTDLWWETVAGMLCQAKRIEIEEIETIKHLLPLAKDGNFDEVRSLFENGASVNYSDIPSFLWAYFKGHTDICKWLLSKGGNINHDGFAEMTLLMAATVSGDVEFASFLIASGAEVNLPLPAGGETALHKAAVRNQVETMSLLIRSRGDANHPTKVGSKTEMDFFGQVWGETPLHIAAVASNQEMIKLLLCGG